MWFFSKKKENIIEKKAKEMLDNMLKDIAIDKEFKTSAEISTDIKDSFLETNTLLLEAFSKANQAIDTNNNSIAILSKTISQILEAFYVLEERVLILEKQLSITEIKFTKNTTN
jgi:hypothetical protein